MYLIAKVFIEPETGNEMIKELCFSLSLTNDIPLEEGLSLKVYEFKESIDLIEKLNIIPIESVRPCASEVEKPVSAQDIKDVLSKLAKAMEPCKDAVTQD